MNLATVLSQSQVRLGLVVLVGAATLAVPANAENPHLVSVAATMSNPSFTPPTLAWDSSLTVPFRVAGLGNNPGLQVSLNARVTSIASVTATTQLNTLLTNFGFTLPSGFSSTTVATASAPGSLQITLMFHQVNATLTSEKNGNVSGTLVIPALVTASIPDNLLCVKVSWTQIVLTVNGQAVALPDVSGKFDSTGSLCQ